MIFGTYEHFSPLFIFYLYFHLTYSRWTSSLPSFLSSLRIFPSLPDYLSRYKFNNLTTRQPMVELYLLTFPRFPLLQKKEHTPYSFRNRTHDFRTSRCADYLLDHSGDERWDTNSVLYSTRSIETRWNRRSTGRLPVGNFARRCDGLRRWQAWEL